ncbi:MAG: DUF2024 family protein [Prevotella sp.]|nr:DUF2024 family protein [Prevotella sp.]
MLIQNFFTVSISFNNFLSRINRNITPLNCSFCHIELLQERFQQTINNTSRSIYTKHQSKSYES